MKPTPPRPRTGLICLMCVLLASVAGAEPATRPAATRPSGTVAGKRLIEFGWDEPDTAFLRRHLAEMRATPFDGCVFHTKYLKGDGKDEKDGQPPKNTG